MQRRHHYEQAFEHYLRSRRVPYVAVDEARKALLPFPAAISAAPRHTLAPRPTHNSADEPPLDPSLKSFDFVLYGQSGNLLAEVKGRKIASRAGPDGRLRPTGRLECWVTQEDISSLSVWERLFGPSFQAALIFVYWCDQQPALPLFEDIFDFRGRWYAMRAVTLEQYTRFMRPRSPRWGTVHMPTADFDRASRTLCGPVGQWKPVGAAPVRKEATRSALHPLPGEVASVDSHPSAPHPRTG